MLPCIFDQLPSWQLSGEVFKLTARRLQFWICSFSPRLHWWGQEWNTLVGTNQDKKSPGTHLAWPCGYHPPSGFLFAGPSFLRWWSSQNRGQLKQRPPSTCLISSTKAFPLCDETTPNPTWCHKQALSICNVELLLFGEKKGEKGPPP